MIKWLLAAGAAALALTSPALAGPDKGKGGGKGPERVERGERGDRGDRADRGGRGGDHAERRMVRADRSERRDARNFVRERRDNDRDDRRVLRDERKAAKAERRAERELERETRSVRIDDDRDDRRFERNDDDRRFAAADRWRGSIRGFDDCPPGLARKNNGCLPPGQARKLVGALLPAALGAQMLEGPFSQWYRDDAQYLYRNDGDFIYRVRRDGGLVDALFPFQDRDFSYYDIGTPYPADYNFYNVPQQYRSFYPDGTDYLYRYGDGAIYQVDPSNNMISSIVALLAGDLAVGQPLPSDYGVYNVPMAYRDRYYDTPDALYRYNDGYIYQADPKTQLITAVIDALV